MTPLTIRINRIIDYGAIVSLVGVDHETDKPVTLHIDHRPFASFCEAWREAGSRSQSSMPPTGYCCTSNAAR